jgi:uncharacterized protein (DUF2252 family)
MTRQGSLSERREFGRSLRKSVSRSAHEAIGQVDRDPVALLEQSSKGRVPRLVPLRYGRMLTSPFAFYRGSAIIQAHDLATTPHAGIVHQICGDCHLMNFGGFATPERQLIFDLNDFDETHPGPWEWDVKRLAASFTVAARHLGYKQGVADDIVFAMATSYQRRLAEYARLGALDTWYDKLTFDRIYAESNSEAGRKLNRRLAEKASRRGHEALLPKLGDKKDGRWRMYDTPPALFHIHGESTLFEPKDDWSRLDHWEALSDKLFADYLKTLSASHQLLLSFFTKQDLAFKVVGVGSVGTRCLVLLMVDALDNPLFLQIKEAVCSVLAPYVPAGKSPYKNEGQRVVAGQRMMQASSDHFLGWSVGPNGRHFYLRQLRDMKVSVELETMSQELVGLYGTLCGRALARAHAKAGGSAVEVSGYLGRSDQFATALVRYANAYADQVERDYESFRAACRSGRVMAQSEADFGADIRV